MIFLNSQSGRNKALVFPAGQLYCSTEGTALLSDPFDGTTIDTVNRWLTPVLAGTGTVTQASGVMTFSVGTTVSNAAALTSIESFGAIGQGSLKYGTLVQFEAGTGSGSSALLPIGVNAFYGQGTPNASFTAATPLADAIGFERDIDGKFRAVTYAGNTRAIALDWKTFVAADLTQYVVDGAPHLIVAYARGDYIFFFVDDLENYKAVSPLAGPATTYLPMRAHAINHTAAPAVAPTIKYYATAAVDSSDSYPVNFNGQTVQRARSPAVFKNISAVASGTTLWTPASGRKFRLQGYVLMTTVAAGVLTLTDSGNATVIPGGIIPVGIVGPTVSPPQGNGYLGSAINGTITQTFTGAGALSGYLFGTEE